MMTGGPPRPLQGACSRCSSRSAAHSTSLGFQSLRVGVPGQVPAQMLPNGLKVSPVSPEVAAATSHLQRTYQGKLADT